MNFSISTLIAGTAFGLWGVFLLRRGRADGNVWFMFIAVAMLTYPYFISNAWVTWGIGAGLMWLAWVKRDA